MATRFYFSSSEIKSNTAVGEQRESRFAVTPPQGSVLFLFSPRSLPAQWSASSSSDLPTNVCCLFPLMVWDVVLLLSPLTLYFQMWLVTCKFACFWRVHKARKTFSLLLVKATEWCFFSPLITVDFPRSFYKEIIRATGRIIIIRECSWHSGRTFKNVKIVPDLCRSVEQTHISLSGCQRGFKPSVCGNNGSDETLILGAASKAPVWSFFRDFSAWG